MRDQLATESAEEGEARLQYMRDRLATESAEEREVRLQQMKDRLGLCVLCCRDKHIPKMCSSANNMDPGPLPPQLQVGTYTCK